MTAKRTKRQRTRRAKSDLPGRPPLGERVLAAAADALAHAKGLPSGVIVHAPAYVEPSAFEQIQKLIPKLSEKERLALMEMLRS